VDVVNALGRLTLFRIQLEVVAYVYTSDHQYVLFQLYFASCFRDQPAVSGRNVTRLQRAAKGAGQSAGGRGHDVIEGGCVRIVDVGIDAVMLGDFGVDAEEGGGFFGREIGAAERAFDAFDAHV